ncbi:MAG: phosphatidylglycerophosphatase A [Balneolaceae bacterium]
MNRLKAATATLFGAGLIPVAPGTWGSLFSLILIYPAAILGGTTGLLAVAVAGSLLTLWSAGYAEKKWGPDPSKMVIDELSGLALVYLMIPFTGDPGTDLIPLFGGFLLFRLFDIRKPFGINRLQHFPSGFGILLDDLGAGLYACFVLHIARYLAALI